MYSIHFECGASDLNDVFSDEARRLDPQLHERLNDLGPAYQHVEDITNGCFCVLYGVPTLKEVRQLIKFAKEHERLMNDGELDGFFDTTVFKMQKVNV